MQPDSALWAIRAMQGPVPAVILLLGVSFVFMYPITRNNHKAISRRLQRREDSQNEL